MKKIIWIILFTAIFSSVSMAAATMPRFNHEAHEKGAFKNLNFNCNGCHNFTLAKDNTHLTLDAGLEKSAFKTDMKNMCHQCHNTEDSKLNKSAPKECVFCHNANSAKEIKPLSHQNTQWRNTHSLKARIEGTACLNCHIQSECLKCHLNRNDIEMTNHSRNFKFTHSVEARGQPHRCDACHTQNFCVKCHIGK